MPGASVQLGREGGGGGGEDRGINGAPFYPPSLRTPEENSVEGRGVEGGRSAPHTKPAPSPYPPPSLAWTKGPKVRGRDGSGKGVGACCALAGSRFGNNDSPALAIPLAGDKM